MDTKFGTVVDTVGTTGVKIVIDGEDVPRQKTFNTLESYKASEDDRVYLSKNGEDYIVLGSVAPLVEEESTGQTYNWDMYKLADVIEKQEYIEEHESKELKMSPFFRSSDFNVVNGFTYMSWDPSGKGYRITEIKYGYTNITERSGSYHMTVYLGSITYTATKHNIFVNKKGKGDLIERVTSKNREAYPDSGELNGFWYEFKG